MRILILGASGMLGSAVFRYLQGEKDLTVYGSIRSSNFKKVVPKELQERLIVMKNFSLKDDIEDELMKIKPNLVINCVGLVKQLKEAHNPILSLTINSIFPHRLAHFCKKIDARLIHISTDCVFSGSRGMYSEESFADANDLYGRSKFLGEVDYPNAITLRTSIIGHELQTSRSLIDWFLSQEGFVEGYRRAIFSGLPTVELAKIITNFVIPKPDMTGLYHVSADPINKYDLLNMVAQEYGKKIQIKANDFFMIDRSLDSSKFRAATGYLPKPWKEMIHEMHEFG